MSDFTDLQLKLYSQCAVTKCSRPMQPNNEGGLDLTASGGYGDFTDSFGEDINTFRLCHRHAHKFANWLNNPEVLGMYWGHSHAGYEPGFWFGHPSWEQRTWLSYVTIFFHSWYKQGWKTAKYYLREQLRSHKNWSRVDINDHSTKVQWGKYIGQFFFLDNHSKGFFVGLQRKLHSKLFTLAKNYHRKHSSLYNEIWQKAINGELSESEKAYLKDLGLALKHYEDSEEE